MKSINTVTISGNLGQDPELRSLPSGTELIELRVAVSDNVKRNDKWEKRTHWVQCTLFGRGVEFFSQHLRKGSFVVIQGRLNYEEWAKDGVKRNKLTVIVDEIDMGPRMDRAPAERHQSRTSEGHLDIDRAEDDIPF